LLESPENGADISHLNTLHESFIFPPLQPIVKHYWTASWKPSSTDKHKTQISILESMVVFGRKMSWLDVKVEGCQIGCGTVSLRLLFPLFD